MACIVEPQELILEQTVLYVFVFFQSSMEWRLCFLKKVIFKKITAKFAKFWFFVVKFVLKKWDKHFFQIFLDVILFKI